MSRRPQPSDLTIALAAAISVVVGITTAPAAEPPDSTGPADGRRVLQQAIQGLRPQPSTDTSPVAFSVGGIDYVVPRNYILSMDNWSGGPQVLVTLRVNAPDMKPLTAETLPCFTAPPASRPPGCLPFEFALEGPAGPSAEQAFNNAEHLFHNRTAIAAPFGYERFDMGPPDFRVEYYRKTVDHHTNLYSCQIFDNQNRGNAVCSTVADHVATGATIDFNFYLHQLADIEAIDLGIRKLVESFTASRP